MNISLVSSDVSMVVRWFFGENVTPKGSNWGHWRNPDFDALLLKMEGAADPERVPQGARLDARDAGGRGALGVDRP